MKRTAEEKKEMVKMVFGEWKCSRAMMYALSEAFNFAGEEMREPKNAKRTDTKIKITNLLERLTAMQEEDIDEFCLKNGEKLGVNAFYPGGTEFGKDIQYEAWRFIKRVRKLAEAKYVKDLNGGGREC